MMFADMMNDRISLLKTDQTRVDNVPASVQGNKIYVMQSSPLIESGDLLFRTMSNGAQEKYRVVDPGFHEAFDDIPAGYQMTVEKLGLAKIQLAPTHAPAPTTVYSNTYNIHNSPIGALQAGNESVANIGHGEAAKASRAALDPKIEIVTGPSTPYHVTDVHSGHVQSTVRIGIKNAGGKTFSNCKVYIEKISPPTNSPGGTTLLLEGTGFQLRHDDPEKIIDVAAHWDNNDKFRFSTPIGGGFFDTTEWMDDNTRRTFAIRVTATECERSALFEILADESRKLHLKFLNYIN
jgi:hypothetical protein